MKTYKFPQTVEPHLASIVSRVRNSGLTSCRFIDDNRMIACDFNERMSYLINFENDELTIIDQHPTLISDGSPVQTDLMDLKGNEFAVSNFYQGSVSFYNIVDNKIEFIREINPNTFKNLHGVRYVPNYDDLIWLTYCGIHNKCSQVVNSVTGEVIHTIQTSEQAQDVAFVANYAVVFARTDHISKGKVNPGLFDRKRRIYATAYTYELPNNLMESQPKLVATWRGKGHIDACKEQGGFIYCANQYLDTVDVFTVNEKGKLALIKQHKGFGMPHGLDILGNTIAVTNYSDQSMRILSV